MRNFLLWMMVIITIQCAMSCGTNKRLTDQAIYFKGITDSSLRTQTMEFEPLLQKGDILSITVSTANEATARIFNSAKKSGETSEQSLTSIDTYLVDIQGNIVMPLIGKVRVAGLNKADATAYITEKIRTMANDAIVSLRLLNYKITILGEVARPSSYSIPNERVSILDAIGLAGDLTVFGKRDNIKIIREVDGRREMGIIDLNKGDVFNSPYFYLRQNDVVYVEMNERKIANADQSTVRTMSIVLGAVSAVTLIITAITRF